MKTAEQQMSMYAAYHRNFWNKATHFIGLPAIIFSILVPAAWLHFEIDGTDLSIAPLLALALLIYYFLLDVSLALAMAILIGLMLYFAQQIAQMSFTTAFIVHVATFWGGLALQLIGHLFEGRKPAFMTNLIQAVVGPLYIMAEVFFALGLKKDLERKIEDGARQFIVEPR